MGSVPGFDLEVQTSDRAPAILQESKGLASANRPLRQWHRNRQHPLPHRHFGKYMVNEMSRRIGHAPAATTRAKSSNMLARIRNREVLAADIAVNPDKTVGPCTEMKRINIEFSYNLARLIQLLHEDEDCFYRLLCLSYQYLPMPQMRSLQSTRILDSLQESASLHISVPAIGVSRNLVVP
jgi:hypothetical protein